MQLLPPIPKTNRKFPIARPYGNPTGPISLVGRQDGAPAISVGLRRSASSVPFIMSSTLGQMPDYRNVPPSPMAVPLIRAETGMLGQMPDYRNIPPSQMAMPVMHAEGRRMMTNLAALKPMPSVSDQIRELKQAYSAEAVSGKYVNDIKMAVRYDYGENPYAGYATARRDAQYNSPAFMGSAYFYPDQFQHRGISLAGALGDVTATYNNSLTDQWEVVGDPRYLRSMSGVSDISSLTKDQWGQRPVVNDILLQPGETVKITSDMIRSAKKLSKWGGDDYDYVLAVQAVKEIAGQTYTGWVVFAGFKDNWGPFNTKDYFFKQVASASSGAAQGATTGAAAGVPVSENGQKPKEIPQSAWNSITSAAKVFGIGVSEVGKWWNELPIAEKRMYWQLAKQALNLNITIAALETGPAATGTGTYSAEDIAKLMAARDDNTLLYVGLGVAAIVVVGIVGIFATKK